MSLSNLKMIHNPRRNRPRIQLALGSLIEMGTLESPNIDCASWYPSCTHGSRATWPAKQNTRFRFQTLRGGIDSVVSNSIKISPPLWCDKKKRLYFRLIQKKMISKKHWNLSKFDKFGQNSRNLLMFFQLKYQISPNWSNLIQTHKWGKIRRIGLRIASHRHRLGTWREEPG